MNLRTALLLTVLAVIVAVETIWVRFNLEAFEPVLTSSLLFFQLVIAVTVIAVLRNLIGIKSFGVFGPAIIALGIAGTSFVTGLVIYIDIFLVAMVTSFALHGLGMTSSHRVAIVVTLTALTITILELVGEVFHAHQLESALLFPVLITAWLGDRFVSQVLELDWIDPSKRLAGTFIVVVAAFMVMGVTPLVRFIALTPETWGPVILLNIVLAFKADLRLLERRRFRPTIEASGEASDVLGMNRRNRDIIERYNPRHLFPSMSKDRMKVTFHQLGIPTPATYAMVDGPDGLPRARREMEGRESFVIKPSRGYGGEGILVVTRKGDAYLVKGVRWTLDALLGHIKLILDGQFSKGFSDVAIIEQRVVSDARIAPYHAGGVPDVRVIVLEGFPIMAMTRLPTRESQGAANLHKGAIGMGLTIAEGRGVNPFWRGHGGTVEVHPDTGARLRELAIPDWTRALEIASLAQAASRLGYAGVDLVFDTSGAMVLEVNKRPGLEIQNTNLAGLLKRIRHVEGKLPEHRFAPIPEKVRLAQRWDAEGWR